MIEASAKIEREVQDMLEMLHNLQVTANILDMDWQSPAAEEVQDGLMMINSGLTNHAQALGELGRTLRRQAETWMESDHLWVQQYRARG